MYAENRLEIYKKLQVIIAYDIIEWSYIIMKPLFKLIFL